MKNNLTKKLMERNIKLQYIIGSLMWGRFFIPVIALFYIASQVTLEQFTIIFSVFALATLVLEIPSGVVADIIGKKKTLILSRALYIIEVYILAFHNGFLLFLIAKIISGFGVSLSSGTSSALLYDTLKKLKIEKEHKRISGKLQTITSISMAVVFIIGGVLFSVHYKLPALLSLPLLILGFILTFWITEPYKSKKKLTIKTSVAHLKEGLRLFWKNKYIKYIILLSIPIATTISIMYSLSSAYFEKILIPIALIGAVAFIGSLIAAYTSKKSHKLEEKLGEKSSLRLIQISVIIAILLMATMANYVGVLFYYIIPFVAAFSTIIINDYTNKHIQMEHRATILSIKNFFGELGIFIIFPLVGYFIKTDSMSASFRYLGIFFAVYLIILAVYHKK